MPETYSLRVTASCVTPTPGAGLLSCELTYVFTPGGGMPGDEVPTALYLLTAGGYQLRELGAGRNTTVEIDALANDYYTVEWREVDTQRVLAASGASINCGPGAGALLQLDSVSATDETAAGGDGTATIQASGGVAPLTATLVDLSMSQPASSGQPNTFTGVPMATYTLRVVDSSTPPQLVQGQVTVGAYVPPKAGCQDEYATNYDPAATTAAACTYAPLWRSAWGPSRMAVPVPALPGQVKAYTQAMLRIGFRPGHPLAAIRPLGDPIPLRATVGPQGFAVFRLAPYLQRAIGAADGLGGYRLDLNSPSAATTDLSVAYELRRTTGELLEHGYALNAAVPDAELIAGAYLSPFLPLLPLWPGFDDYLVGFLGDYANGRYAGTFAADKAFEVGGVWLPCPSNPLPVAWLAPGGYGYWVFQGRPQLGDDVGEGQSFTEATTGERRWSQRGEARGTIAASSGVFNGPQFAEGLRTLWRSPQVWYQPEPGGEWVPVTLDGGQFPVRRMGLARTEVSITFTEARPHYAQGQ